LGKVDFETSEKSSVEKGSKY